MDNSNLNISLSLQLLSEGKSAIIRAVGMSMFPWILPKESLIISPIKDKDLKVGDIIIFTSNNKLIAHRLLKIDKKNNIYVTRGDGNLTSDSPIKHDDIIGIISEVRDNRMFWTKYANGKMSYLIAKFSFIFSPFNWFLGKIIAKLISKKR